MQRILLAVASAAALAALVVAPPGGAARPEHLTFGPIVTAYDDFCGTGAAVTETFSARLNVWDGRNQSVVDDVFTSPSTGVTVVSHSAYLFTDVLLSSEPSGVNTHQWTFNGAAQLTRVGGGGGVVISDTGRLVVQTTWSGPEFDSELLAVDVEKDAGGHPTFSDDFCSWIVPALGLA